MGRKDVGIHKGTIEMKPFGVIECTRHESFEEAESLVASGEGLVNFLSASHLYETKYRRHTELAIAKYFCPLPYVALENGKRAHSNNRNNYF